LEENPLDADAWLGLGNLLEDNGDFLGAVSHWHTAWDCKNEALDDRDMYRKLAKHHFGLWEVSHSESCAADKVPADSGVIILDREPTELIICINAWEEILALEEKADREEEQKRLRSGKATDQSLATFDSRQQVHHMMSCLYFESGNMERSGELLGRVITHIEPNSSRYRSLVHTAAGMMNFVGLKVDAVQYMEYCLEHPPSTQSDNDQDMSSSNSDGFTNLDVMLQLALLHEAVLHEERRRGKRTNNRGTRRKMRGKGEEVNKAELAFEEVFRLLNDSSSSACTGSSNTGQSDRSKRAHLSQMNSKGSSRNNSKAHNSDSIESASCHNRIMTLTEHKKWGKQHWREWSEAAATWGEVGDRFASLAGARLGLDHAKDLVALPSNVGLGGYGDLSLGHVHGVGGGISILPAIAVG
jgi:tetratricopeptide (TPR) repeat protein